MDSMPMDFEVKITLPVVSARERWLPDDPTGLTRRRGHANIIYSNASAAPQPGGESGIAYHRRVELICWLEAKSHQFD